MLTRQIERFRRELPEVRRTVQAEKAGKPVKDLKHCTRPIGVLESGLRPDIVQRAYIRGRASGLIDEDPEKMLWINPELKEALEQYFESSE